MLKNGNFLCDFELVKVCLVLQVVYLLLQQVVFLGQVSDVTATVIEDVVKFTLQLENSSLQLLIFSCYSLQILFKVFAFLGQLFVFDLKLDLLFVFVSKGKTESVDLL